MPEGAAPPLSPQSGDFETSLAGDAGLELRVWLRLLTCSTLIERQVRQHLREDFDFTLPRFDLLAQLDREPEGLTMGALSRRLMVTTGNVTGLIDRLVAEGLVERQPAPGDRRAQLVRLTPAGKRAFDRMTPAHAAWIHKLFAGLDHAALTTLFDSLAKLKTSLANAERG
jgi:DNA-binding MarR family transcriptional regulator